MYHKRYFRDPALDYVLDWWAAIHDRFNRCHACHWRRATWSYMPGRACACDEYVWRGCSCAYHPEDGNHENEDPANWVPDLDEQGRKMPCCEWWSINNPPTLVWSNDPEEMKRIQESGVLNE